MQTWNFNLETATDVDIMDTLVGYVRYYQKTAGSGMDPRIRLKTLGGGGVNVELLPGQGYRLDTPVRGLVVENMSGAAISGKLAISPTRSNFEDDRITGEVSVIDSSYAQVLAGTVFQATHFFTAVNFATFQLKNTSPTGYIELLGSDLWTSGAVLTTFGMYPAASALLASLAPGPYSNIVDPAAMAADPAAEFRFQDLAAPAIVTNMGLLAVGSNLALDRFRPSKPLLIKPGASMVFKVNTVGQQAGLTLNYARR